MANETLFGGGELDSLTIVGGSPSESAAAVFDGSYARRAILTTDQNAIVRHNFLDSSSAVATVVTGETIWVHFEVYFGGTANTQQIVKLLDSSNQPWFAIQGGGTTGTLRAAYNSNTGASPTWTALGAGAFTTGSDAVKRFDIKLTLGSPHSYEVYYADNLVASGTFTQASLTALAGVQYNGFSDGTDCYWSQMMATRGLGTVTGRVNTRAFSAAGNSNNFTSGAYTDINEGALNDATAMVSDTAGQVYTLTIDDTTVPAGMYIPSVFTWARGRNNGASPTNFQHAIRRSSTNYFSPNVANISASYGPLGANWATDPSGGAWSQAGWNAAELGGKSIA